MTHNEWEAGKQLTIHNATREQLKFMVKDRDATIKRLLEELEQKKKEYDTLLHTLVDKIAQ